MSSTALDFDLTSVHVRFRCAFAPLMEYAKAHLAPILGGALPTGAPQVDAELYWHEGHPPADPTVYPEVRQGERFDRDLWVGKGTAAWLRIDELRDLHLRFAWNGERLGVRGDYYHRLSTDSRADRVRRLVYRGKMSALRRKRFTRLLYYVVYYPVFWWLEHERDMHPLHAAGVATSAGGILLAGPSGVGKSTLSMALGAEEGARILSDTFVAHHGTQVRAVPEPVLLDRWSVHWLGDTAARLAGVDHGYGLGRDGYSIPSDRFAPEMEAAVVVLPRRSTEHFVRRIGADDALARIDAYDDIVNDLRRYRALAAVLELLAPVGLARARLRSLEALTAAAPCYELGLSPALSRAEAVSALLAIRDGRDQPRTASGLRGGR